MVILLDLMYTLIENMAERPAFEKAGGKYAGPVSLENATLASDNTVYAQLAIDVGPANIVDMAKRLGVRSSPLKPVPSITLGSAAVSPLEMTSAYATLASGGIYRKPTAIKQVTDADGQVLLKQRVPGIRVIEDGVAAEVTRILEENMIGGTGTGAMMSDRRPEAGKTGTTDDHTDAWFCGYTPTLATCVWIGYPDETKPMYNVEGVGAVSGPTLPADIWHLFMDAALEGTPPVSFAAPKRPVKWSDFASRFASLVVSTVTAPDLTLQMPPPRTVTVTEPAPPTVTEPAPEPAPATGAVTELVP
jgi:penicillin-binding protein 1A